MVIRKPTYVPESRATREVKKEDLFERTGDEPVQAGLQLTASNRKEQAGQPKRESDSLAVKQEDVEMQDGVNGTSSTTLRSNIKIEQGTTDVGDEDSIETRAMKALLMDQQGEDKKSDLVIAMNEDTLDLRSMPVDETDAFRRDVVTRPTEVSGLSCSISAVRHQLIEDVFSFSPRWMTTLRLLLRPLEKLSCEEWAGNQIRAKDRRSMSRRDGRTVLVSVPPQRLKRRTGRLARNKVRNVGRIRPNALEGVMFLSSRRKGIRRSAARQHRATEHHPEHLPDLRTRRIVAIQRDAGTTGAFISLVTSTQATLF
jgi:hypothetical protein